MNAINKNEFDKNFVEFEIFNYLYHNIRVRRCIRNRNHFSNEFVNCFSRIDRNDFDNIQQ